MRRRILLLSAGLLAYQFGAAVNLYLRRPEACSCSEVRCRIADIIEYRRAALAEAAAGVRAPLLAHL